MARCLLVVMGMLAAAARPSHAGAPLVAVVRVATDDDNAVLARIEGQTSDLDVELIIEHAAPGAATGRALDPLAGDASMSAQLTAARALAARHGARVVVWFRRDDDAWIVQVAEPAAERMLLRRVATDRGKMAGSAAAEAAALVVRTALRALAAGGSIGVEEPEPEADPEVPSPPIVSVPLPPPPPSQSALTPLRPYAELGWLGIIDGASRAGHHGGTVRIGGAAGRWRLAIGGAYHPAVSFRRIDATIEVQRVFLGVVGGVDLLGAAGGTGKAAGDLPWRVSAEVALGVTRFGRTTLVTSEDLVATPGTTTWGPTAGPAARIARRVVPGAWIELAIGIDLIAQAPEFGVGSGETFMVHTRLRPAQPHAGLGLVVDMF